MKLLVLGSGSGAVPFADRKYTGHILKVGSEPLVVDYGTGCFHQTVRAGVNHRKIRRFFFTHTHLDHVNDFASFMFSLISDKKYAYKTIEVFGPKGFKKFLKALFIAYPQAKKPPQKLKIKELSKSSFRVAGLSVKTIPIKHSSSLKSIAYRFSRKGKSIVFSGDCGYDKKLEAFAKNANILVMDSTLVEGKRAGVHPFPSEIAIMAEKANPKTLLLTHISHEVLKSNFKKIIRKRFKGKIVVAKDLMELKV